MSVTEKMSTWMAGKVSRRSFLVRGMFGASAVAAGRTDFLLKPTTAYGALCTSVYCGSSNCACSDTCCAGYTEFCCVLNGGYNSCPEGTIMGGWWMAEGSAYCSGPRYYMDCNATCKCTSGCGGGFSFCDTGCDGLTCECAGGNCGNYLTGCFQFRYGQCNQDVGCIGRIHCRVVTCVPPWEIDPSCTTTSAYDNGTADQNASCLGPGPTYPPPPAPPPIVSIIVAENNAGYWVVGDNGEEFGYGVVVHPSTPGGLRGPVVAATTCNLGGYWMLTSEGEVVPEGNATQHGQLSATPAGGAVSIAGTRDGKGYWILSGRGEVFAFGSAAHLGSVKAGEFNSPAVAIIGDPAGPGYWVVAEGGRVKAFGGATWHGDAAPLRLGNVFVGGAATPDGKGYWIVTRTGRVQWYGDAKHWGGAGDTRIPAPIVAMAATRTGKGYYLVGRDGHVYHYGDAVYRGQPA